MADRDPLIVGILYPSDFDPVPFLDRLGPASRLVEVRVGHYEDDSHLRLMKRHGGDIDEVRRLQPELTPAT
ncbi:MAG TPA: hypothetical protein VKQ71_07465, partial [Acidimicrobiales bacterium]|nr:hypothetical protein [Acidimicrobiales bacterium]